MDDTYTMELDSEERWILHQYRMIQEDRVGILKCTDAIESVTNKLNEEYDTKNVKNKRLILRKKELQEKIRFLKRDMAIRRRSLNNI